MPAAVLLRLRADGRCRALNRKARDLFAVEHDEDADLHAAIEPSDRARLEAALMEIAGGATRQVPLDLWVRDGTGESRQLSGALSACEDGSRDVIFAGLDVSHISRENRSFRSIVENVAEGIAVHRDGELLYVSPRQAEMIGLASFPELSVDLTLERFIHPEDRERVASYIARRAAGEDAPQDYEFRLLHVDGSVIWVNCRASVTDWQGKPAIVASLFDISEQKRALRDRVATEQLFERIFELSPDVITLSRTADGKFQFVNEAFLETMGYRREEVIGRTSADLHLWKDPAQRVELLDRLAAHGSVQNFECRMCRSDGRILDFAMSVTILPYKGEEYVLFIGRDMTEYKRQQRELRRSKEAAEAANRTKSEFLANISHELRTPLNAIIGFSELMIAEALGPLGHEQYRGYCGDILDAGRHLLAIINDILDLSKLEAGRLSVAREPVLVDEIIEPCLRLIRDRSEKVGLELRVEPFPPDLAVLGDIRRLRQILLNLLSNAVKFTADGGRVTVGATTMGRGKVRLFVSDTGIGMSENELEKALTPFGQIDSSLARRYEGAGLGLPIVKALVEMQGGRFHLETASGKGTTAIVILPRA